MKQEIIYMDYGINSSWGQVYFYINYGGAIFHTRSQGGFEGFERTPPLENLLALSYQSRHFVTIKVLIGVKFDENLKNQF